ncbi:ferritin-like protein [Streptomyces sp. NPDC057565]|uniref:ferritin-like domain-containing protein n=1 Tax=Streptomyces sp. NPDC057565 TaxID=3346169 RepID=UPI0036CAD383
MNTDQYTQRNAIVELMRQPAEHRDTGWVQDAVQQAILLELATLPPYLCGLWSIDTSSGDTQVFHTLREIIFDEMSHLGIACNLLTAIGGTPRLASETLVPAYPGPLPGGVRPELRVYLSGLTMDSVRMYASIEEPDTPVTHAALAGYTSIGAFYTAILDAFRANPQMITGKRQVTMDMEHHGLGNTLERLETLGDVESAIAVIKEQGEGTSASPQNPYPGAPGEFAHYYAFQEILHKQKLQQQPGQPDKWDFTGAAVPWPEHLWPMGVVPQGGWPRTGPDAPTPEVTGFLDAFNRAYSDLLSLLEQAWQEELSGSAEDLLQDAVVKMGALRSPAGKLMKIALPDGSGNNYGPEFRYLAP